MKNGNGDIFFRNWFRISLFNLLIVSFVGVILRYKIAFSLPFVNQKYLLNAHSHFAFAGWISLALMAFITEYLHDKNVNLKVQRYQRLLWANLITAYGMLLSFPFEGYGVASIIFSTLNIFTSYALTYFAWRDLNALKLKCVSHYWFKASLGLNVLSSLGAFSLAFMMATNIAQSEFYIAAVYFFLHFQYNGWFFFASMGLFQAYLVSKKVAPEIKISKIIFWLFFGAVIPAYFLSALWLPIPLWIYILVIIGAAAQCIGFAILMKHLITRRNKLIESINKPVKLLWLLSCFSLAIKLLLQMISVVPSLGTYTVGFRPIVIGYLHLVLLGVITIFLIGYFVTNTVHAKSFLKGVTIFVTGIIINETLLLIQGVSDFSYTNVPLINEMLFAAALVMFFGLLLCSSQLITQKLGHEYRVNS